MKLIELLQNNQLRPVYHGDHGLRTPGGVGAQLSDLSRVKTLVKAIGRSLAIPCSAKQLHTSCRRASGSGRSTSQGRISGRNLITYNIELELAVTFAKMAASSESRSLGLRVGENCLFLSWTTCQYVGVLSPSGPCTGPPLSVENVRVANMLLLKHKETPATFPIVCIGGSAGSLAAYVDILGQLPAKFGMAIVIVSHRALHESGRLLTLLAQATLTKVVEAADGMPLKPDCIFVAPPHREITTDGELLRVAEGLTNHSGWPTLIGDFLFSLASRCNSRAMAIIVSGAGHDGSCALRAVKEAGGRTLAQSDASHPDMPQAAMDTMWVDYALTAREIGNYLASQSA